MTCPPITYLTGDATAPVHAGFAIIPHIVNDRGGWGKGFVLAVSKRWPEPEAAYRVWSGWAADPSYYNEAYPLGVTACFALGELQVVKVAHGLYVANMVAQHGYRPQRRPHVPPIRYDALARCLDELGRRALALDAAVHMPRIGCGLAGGTWDLVRPLVSAALCNRGVAVTVYDLPTERVR